MRLRRPLPAVQGDTLHIVGVGDNRIGKDRFDAAVGLFGTVNVLRGSRAPGDPIDTERRTIEGWILGQVDL